MALTPEAIRATVEAYVQAVATGTVDDVLALFAPDATVEDPVGTPVRTTEAQLREFYGMVAPLEQEGEVLTVRVADDSAAFHFRLVTIMDDQRFELSPIDVMTFDEDAKITSMRAYWGPEDMVTG